MSDTPEQVHGYDPTANPRSLRPVPDPEQLGELAMEEERLAARLNVYHRLAGVFGSKGWLDLDNLVQGELQRAVNALADPKQVNSSEALAYVQGQMQTLSWLRGLPQQMETLKAMESEQLRDVRNTQKEAKAQARQDAAATLGQGG